MKALQASAVQPGRQCAVTWWEGRRGRGRPGRIDRVPLSAALPDVDGDGGRAAAGWLSQQGRSRPGRRQRDRARSDLGQTAAGDSGHGTTHGHAVLVRGWENRGGC